MNTKIENLSDEVSTQKIPFFLTKFYRPTKPTTLTEEQRQRFREGMHDIQHNLRFDEKRQMTFFLPKDHPEYKELPEGVEERNNWCNIL